MSEVLVLVENTPQGIRKSSLELLTAARRLGSPSAVLCGAADDAAEERTLVVSSDAALLIDSAVKAGPGPRGSSTP